MKSSMLVLLVGLTTPALAQEDPARAADSGAPGQHQVPAGDRPPSRDAQAADSGAPGQHQVPAGERPPSRRAQAADSGAPGQHQVPAGERTPTRDSSRSEGRPARPSATTEPLPERTASGSASTGDGRVDETARATGREERRAAMLRRYDADGDGRLSEQERTRRDDAIRSYRWIRDELGDDFDPSTDLDDWRGEGQGRAPGEAGGADVPGADVGPGGTTGPGTSDPDGGAPPTPGTPRGE